MSAPTSLPVTGGRDAATGGPVASQTVPAPTADAAPNTDTASVTGSVSATDSSSTREVFDSTQAWQLNPKVALRPEPFGALLYHFGTRKLSFLKNLTVVGIVESLRDHDSADDALAAAGIDAAQRRLYVQALDALAASEMICRRAA